jgi:hypothetical protein
VTVTSTVPTDPAGACTVSDVFDVTLNAVAATPPKCTPLAPVKPLPVTVTLVPPAVVPEDGETPVTVGAAGHTVMSLPDEDAPFSLRVAETVARNVKCPVLGCVTFL